MPARAHRVLRIVTHRRPATAQDKTLGKLPSMRRWRAWARSLYRLLQVELGFGGA
jgi:hypothetical protein